MISIFECRMKLHSSVICTPRLNLNKAFSQKLTLFEIQLSRSCFIHFSRCEKYSQKAVTTIPCSFTQNIILGLKNCARNVSPIWMQFFQNKTLRKSVWLCILCSLRIDNLPSDLHGS